MSLADPVISSQRRKPRKQSDGPQRAQGPLLGDWRAPLLTPESSLWSVGLSVSTQPAMQGDLPSLGARTRLFLCGSLQNVFVVTYCSWKGRQLYTGYILAVDGCPPLDLLAPTSMEKPLHRMWRLSGTVAASECRCRSLSERDVQ